MLQGWDKSMSTGVQLVDSEHQGWFQQADRLNQALQDGKGREEIDKILKFVGDYVVTHFAHEEKIMADYRCPVADANKAAHNKFIGRFKDLQTKYEKSGASSAMAIEIQDLLRNWLVEHIRTIDSKLLDCVNGGSVAKQPALSK
jgi:hemerythrin